MARPLRVEYPGGVYHVTSRGNAGSRIFRSDADRTYFLGLLAATIARFHWLCHGYCLMNNHYHLLIETPDGNLSHGMRHLNGVCTQKWNWRYKTTGHLFQGRYKAVIVDKDAYLLELSRYIVLNPVRAAIVSSPQEWTWSSYQAMAGLTTSPAWLTIDWLLGQIGKEKGSAQKRYVEFVREGIARESIWNVLKGQVFLGDKDFIEQQSGGAGKQVGEVPRAQRFASRKNLSELFVGVGNTKQARNQIIRVAHLDHGYSLKDIADFLGLHYTTISKVLNTEK